MLEFGYVRFYRSLINWEWYTDRNTKDLLIHLILTANYEPKKWRGITVERGQRVYSLSKIAEELHMSVRNVRTAINHLISTGEVTKQITPQYSIITINNYDE
jgi:AraC-like DNA-binding protein